MWCLRRLSRWVILYCPVRMIGLIGLLSARLLCRCRMLLPLLLRLLLRLLLLALLLLWVLLCWALVGTWRNLLWLALIGSRRNLLRWP